MLDQVFNAQRLVGERHVHHRGGMPLRAGEVDKAPFSEKIDLLSSAQRVFVHILSHPALTDAQRLQGGNVNLNIEVP